MIRRKTDEVPEEKRHRAHPFWSGTISFGLISIPVQLYPAQRRARVSLRMLDVDGTPLRRRYQCPAEGRIVEAEEIVRGYEVSEGDFVVVADEELEAIEPEKSREIDLQRFVDLRSIPPLYFDRAYVLTPGGDSNKAYRLLAEVMENTRRAGIATFVMRGREYLVAILAEGGVLRAETLRFSEEVRTLEDVGLEEKPEADDAQVSRFEAAIHELEAQTVEPDEMIDAWSENILAVASRKRKEGRDVVEVVEGDETVAAGDDEDELEEVDLLETIRIGLREGNGSR